jgi:hypothetical protein
MLSPDPNGEPMADSSYYRERAEQALRLARENADPELIKSLEAFAAEYNAVADAIDAKALGQDPEDE